MKTFLIAVVISVPSVLFSQSKELKVSRVVQTDSVTKEELYNRAILWASETYNSAENVLHIQNKEEGHIMGKGAFRYVSSIFIGSESTRGYIKYTFHIYFKDGRYKYQFDHFIHEGDGTYDFGLITTDEDSPVDFGISISKKWTNRVWVDIKESLANDLAILLARLEVGMSKPIETEKDDW